MSSSKSYDAAMHTTEHILNQTMVRMFNCGRSFNAHIERKKSKCDYRLTQAPSDSQVAEIEQRVNEVIQQHTEISVFTISNEEACHKYNLDKLPENADGDIRIVTVGNYDACPCIGLHVDNTREIGTFKITTSNFEPGRWRVRFKLLQD